MPQMKPMNWKLLFIFVILSISCYILYKFFPENLTSSTTKKYYQPKMNNYKTEFKW